jgi:O-antigen/teichoic acid export membrane protein
MTAKLLISNFFTPEMVTPYQIAYRYISLVLVAFSVVCMPFWNATTDAYERGDIDWIRKANHRMSVFTMIVAVGLLLMTLVSPWVYDVWIGDSCEVPLSMTTMMAVYVFLLVVSLRYSYFLNGIGALRMQLNMTVMAIVFIPLAWAVSSYTHDIVWFMAVMCFCNVPGIVVNAIQFNKILSGKANGMWRI